jgi:hypothetical protein
MGRCCAVGVHMGVGMGVMVMRMGVSHNKMLYYNIMGVYR